MSDRVRKAAAWLVESDYPAAAANEIIAGMAKQGVFRRYGVTDAQVVLATVALQAIIRQAAQGRVVDMEDNKDEREDK